ncbi:hypothetical protein [Zunongwangia profunda]|uniref:hypothetical protein n=1 Tax=Zunongwangia profunda TaxID=398743 RepID=UPI0030D891DC|tara:strand:+ start:101 stop:832 length:732 start_codon:yes stop_codon:yes gene_type:complete
MKKKLYILISLCTLFSCSPKIRSLISNTDYNKFEPSIEVIVLDSISPPEGSLFIGKIKIGDTGFTTDCSYNKVINEAQTEARKHGANIVQITELNRPEKWGSTCYKIKANLYRNLNPVSLQQLSTFNADSKVSRLPIGADYAIIYIYRPKMITGNFIGYKVRMDSDSVVCTARNGEKCELRLKDYGKHTFWAKTESKDSVVINVERGKEYFIRCGMNPGVLISRPDLNLVENHIAIQEYESMQ